MGQCRLSYIDRSNLDRPALLLLHGFLGASDDWDEVGARLSGEYRSVAVDLPGHGASAVVPDTCFPIAACAAEIIAILDDLSIETANLIGYSMGGRLALYLAVTYPERFSKVILESATPGLRTEADRELRREHDEHLASQLEKRPLADFLEEWYSQPLFASVKARPELLRQVLSMRGTGDAVSLARSLRLMSTGRMPSLWERLENLPRPVLCMAGELDEKYCGIAREMVSLIPRGEIAILSGAGHVLHLEQPDRFIERIQQFLSA